MARVLFAWVLWLAVLPAVAQEWHAGMREITYTDPWSGRAAPVAVWYPTEAPETPLSGIYEVTAAPDAPVAGDRLPLVMISHGWGGNTRGHIGTGLALARRGFVVAALQHAGNATSDNALGDLPELWSVRPAQLAAALDAAAAAMPVDPQRIGLLGYSAGGYTVLAYAGGTAMAGRAAEHCRAHPDDAGFCRYAPVQATTPDLVVDRAPDPRVKAVVALAPVGALFVDGGLARVTVPVRLYRAEHDAMVGAVQLDRIRAELPVPPEYVVVANAGHYAFMTPFAPRVAKRLGDVAVDPPGFDRVAFHAALNAEIATFFVRTLH